MADRTTGADEPPEDAQRLDQDLSATDPVGEQVRQWLISERVLKGNQASGWVAAALRAHGVQARTALWLACEQGRLPFCQWLFERGAAEQVCTVDFYGCTPLFAACNGGHLAVCRWLFERGAAEHMRRASAHGWTPMFAACKGGHLAVCQWLYEHGAAEDVRTATHMGNTPLFFACQKGHLAVCKWLFANGAAEDVHTADDNGWTPMSSACLCRQVSVCQWLVEVGGPAVLDHERVRQFTDEDTRAELLTWVETRLALHERFFKVVLFGMMHKRSGSGLLWTVGGETGLRILVAQFLGVPVKRELENLRGALDVLRGWL